MRLTLLISALTTALILAGLSGGVGIAVAEPDDSADEQADSESDVDDPPSNAEESISPLTPTSIPRSLPDRIHDVLRRPLSVLGNGRVPGQPTTGLPHWTPPPSRERPKESKDQKDGTRPGVVAVRPSADQSPVATQPRLPLPKSASAATIRLPLAPPIAVPLPSVPGVPGTQGLRLSIDLTASSAAYSSVETTMNTLNSLLADAYAPYNPFPPPEPEPAPSFRMTEEPPVIGVDGTTSPMGSGDGGGAAPVLPLPMAPPRVALPARQPPQQPQQAGRPAGALPPPVVIGGGSAGVPTAPIRGSVTPAGPPRTGEQPGSGAPPATNFGVRQGYSQFLRSARVGELAIVALPGLLGLLIATASGGVIGYRQANSGRFLRADAVRFVR